MASSSELPKDDDGWFKRHIIEALNDLKKGHETMLENQQEMHEANISRMKEIASTMHDHEKADQSAFAGIRQDISNLQPLKQIVFGFVTLILVAVMTAWVTSVVVTKQQPASQSQPGRN